MAILNINSIPSMWGRRVCPRYLRTTVTLCLVTICTMKTLYLVTTCSKEIILSNTML